MVSVEPVEYHSRDKVVLVPFEALVISAVTRAQHVGGTRYGCNVWSSQGKCKELTGKAGFLN